MGAAETPYEKLRRRKLEENRRKIEELKLPHISLSLRGEAVVPKPPPAKPRKKAAPLGGLLVAVRRSERKRDPVNYKEVASLPSPYRNLSDRVYASDEARAYAEETAKALQSQLASECPNFIKLMLQSHVTGGFWLGIPRAFCSKHLPKKDTPMTLIDDRGEESLTLYLAEKNGLSAGWRGFAISHELVDGDAVIFELVSRATFKVHIIRQSGYYEAGTRGSDARTKKKRRYCVVFLSVHFSQVRHAHSLSVIAL
ncbi:unnamed protein product [Spirodela intermedia]|uniref:TF-B3 domain-containing protein n=1 Tax=Spirodela intermedia TaxID=51605 RepID=A0A7I8KY29_SPIIN|nr:unnamed protein product [Spirodela intermedia]